jgi:hypothetical protein
LSGITPGQSSFGVSGIITKRTGDRVIVTFMVLSDDEFKLFSNLVHRAGIIIRIRKGISAGTAPETTQANNLTSYYRYYKFVTDKGQGQRELLDLVDSLTINETSFS